MATRQHVPLIDYGSVQSPRRCQRQAPQQPLRKPEVLHGEALPPSLSTQPSLPRVVSGLPASTCLQESSAGSAQEHHGVVVDAGHCHRGQAAVGEDRGGGDRVDDGQRVLEMCRSTVQLLRLQLQRDRQVNRLWQTLAGPPHHQHLGISADKLPTALLCPGKAPHCQDMG